MSGCGRINRPSRCSASGKSAGREADRLAHEIIENREVHWQFATQVCDLDRKDRKCAMIYSRALAAGSDPSRPRL
jgi:hypothetical protein